MQDPVFTEIKMNIYAHDFPEMIFTCTVLIFLRWYLHTVQFWFYWEKGVQSRSRFTELKMYIHDYGDKMHVHVPVFTEFYWDEDLHVKAWFYWGKVVLARYVFSEIKMYVHAPDLIYLHISGLMYVLDFTLTVTEASLFGSLFVSANESKELCVWGGQIFIKSCALNILGFKTF